MNLRRRVIATIATIAVLVLILIAVVSIASMPRTSTHRSITTIATIATASAITKTFQFGTMPANFTLGGYSFNMLSNGTGATVNGSQHTEYTIAYQISNGTKNQTLVFGWEPPCSYNLGLPCKADNTVIPPSPDGNGTAFGGSVDMTWFVNTSTIYLNVTTIQSSSSTETTSAFTNPNNTISVSGLSLCSSNCGYPSPYASALIIFNATVPVSSVQVYVNGTYDSLFLQNPTTTTVACSTAAGQMCSVQLGGTVYSNATYTTSTKYYATCSVPSSGSSCIATSTGSVNTLTRFADEWKGSVPTSFIPVVHGLTYEFRFVATFQDGSTATATAFAIAS